MKALKLSYPKNVRDNKFSYPKIRRNKSKNDNMKKNESIQSFNEDKENLNPDDFWNDCKNVKNDLNLFTSNENNKNYKFNSIPEYPTKRLNKEIKTHSNSICYENPFHPGPNINNLTSGTKEISSEKSNKNLGTPVFCLERLENTEPSSRKKNSAINKSSSNKKVSEYRYAEDDDYFNKLNSINIQECFGFEKINKFNILVTEEKDKLYDKIINQKLNFEVITENYQNEIETTKDYNLQTLKNLQTKKNKNQTSERLHLLYEKGKIKYEVNRLIAQKNEEIKLQEELSKCTFQPVLNKRKIKGERNNSLDINFYERLTNWQNKVENKSKKNKKKYQELEDGTYHPIITEKNLGSVFCNKSILDDPTSRLYLIRCEKARQENEERKKKAYWSSRGSLIKQTSHYSNTLTNLNMTLNKEENLLNNEELQRNNTFKNLQDVKMNLRNQLRNIDGLTIESESDYEF